MGKRLTYEYIYNYFKEYECVLLSKECSNTTSKLKYKCKCGNISYITFSNFKQGRRCMECSGNKKHTYDEVKAHIENMGYELISKEYINNANKLIIKDILGYFYVISYANIKLGRTPNFIHKFNPYTIQNIHLWCELNNKPIKLLSNKYNNNHTLLKWKCLKEDCQEEFEMSWNNIMSNKSCSYCAGKKVGLSNCLATKNPQLALEWHPTKNNGLTSYDVVSGSDKEVWWQCENGHEWLARIFSRNKKNGCPKCSKSKGEKRIKKWLEDNNYIFKEEYNGFVDLVSKLKNRLRFDFLIYNKNNYNYFYLVEYDGHFHYNKIFKDDGHEELLYHDQLKNEYCKNNNIPLLRIPYWEFENIEKLLDNFLNT